MLTIKKLDSSHVQRLRKLALEAYKDHYLHLWYDGGSWYMEKSFSVEQLSDELADTKNHFYIAQQDDQDAGFLKVIPMSNLDGQLGDGYEVERIYFKKIFTGKGLGGGLLEFAAADAIQQSCQYLWLKAMDTSYKAIHFYQKAGFEVIDTTTLDYEPMLPVLRGMVVMRKVL